MPTIEVTAEQAEAFRRGAPIVGPRVEKMHIAISTFFGSVYLLKSINGTFVEWKRLRRSPDRAHSTNIPDGVWSTRQLAAFNQPHFQIMDLPA